MLVNAGTWSTNPAGGRWSMRTDALRTSRCVASSIVAPSVIMTARSPSGVKRTLHRERHSFGRRSHPQRGAAFGDGRPARGEMRVEVVVVALRLVVKENQLVHAAVERELERVLVRRVSPAAVSVVLLGRVGRVVHEDRRAADEIDEPVPPAGVVA